MNIGEVARRAGVRASGIRYYERIGVLPTPERINGRRSYDETVLKELEAIRLAQRAGFSLSEIRTLLYDFGDDVSASERWRILAHSKLPEIGATIKKALDMRRMLELGTRCDCVSLEDCDLLAS